MTKPKIPPFKIVEPKYDGWRCLSRLDEELARAGRKPYLVWICGSAGGEAYTEFETLDEAKQAADALNYYEEYVASVYDSSGERVYGFG